MKTWLVYLLLALPAAAADITALCIGNNAYLRADDQLDTPVNDAILMAQTLGRLNGVDTSDLVFTIDDYQDRPVEHARRLQHLRERLNPAGITLLTDATREEIQIALNALKVRAQGAKLALVFFSGHGMDGQPDGFPAEDTFLLPVEASIPDVNYLDTRAVSLSSVLTALKNAPVTARAVILDCCRSGAPQATAALASSTKNFGDIDERVKAALGKAVVPDATLVAFAASPGRKAAAFLRDTDENSPFTKFLTDQLATGTGNLRDLVEAAAETTETRTGKRQVPYVTYTGAASAIRQITFRTSPVPLPVTTPAMTEAEIERRARELAARMVPQTSNTVPPPSLPASSGSVLDQGAVGKAIQVKLPGEVVMKFAYCPPGSFMMGSPRSEADRSDDEDQAQVRISKGFWMGQYEVTQAQWKALMGSNPSNFPGDDLPVETVSWEDAQAFITKLNQSVPLPAGWVYALPSEAQWEYACRAPQSPDGPYPAFHFGNVLNGTQANCDGNNPYRTSVAGPYLQKTEKVGSYAPNAWGLYDMHGNVWEWCEDRYGDKLPGGTDPVGASNGSDRVGRGGSWGSLAQDCRAADRDWNSPDSRNGHLGFRLAAVPASGAR